MSTLAARARFLHERLDGAPPAGASPLVADVMARWETALGAEGVRRRLAWSGPARAGPGRHGRDWEGGLRAALVHGPGAARCLDPAVPVAFEDVLLPFVDRAAGALERRLGEGVRVLSPEARATLERGLLGLLSALSTPTLLSEFELRRALGGRPDWWKPEGGTEAYRSFVAELRAGHLGAVLEHYPALARLLSLACEAWIDAQAEMVARFGSDAAGFACAFGLAGAPLRIASVVPGCSDPHGGGRSVAILGLPGGAHVVYKPRPVDMEAGLHDLLAWANRQGFGRKLRPCRVVARGDYGWSEFVAPSACGNLAEVEAFYERLGGLLCLWWFLQGTDMHHENLVAAGDQPVIVDAETLLHPRPSAAVRRCLGPGTGADRIGDEDDLAGTGFLPIPGFLDFSAFGRSEARETPFRVAACRDVNTDAMAIRATPFTAAPRPNHPRIGGWTASADGYAGCAASGFGEMFRLVLRFRDGFRAEVDRFHGRRGRFVVRASNVYGLLQRASLQPEHLRDGAARGVLFDVLRRGAVSAPARPPCWTILDREIEALERFDIPHVQHRCDRASACWGAPLDEVRSRIASASELNLGRHRAALEAALSCLGARGNDLPDRQAMEDG